MGMSYPLSKTTAVTSLVGSALSSSNPDQVGSAMHAFLWSITAVSQQAFGYPLAGSPLLQQWALPAWLSRAAAKGSPQQST